MSMFTAFNISASGMTAQQLRTDVISENIANADTTRTRLKYENVYCKRNEN